MSEKQVEHSGHITRVIDDVCDIKNRLPSTPKIVGWIVAVLVVLQSVGIYFSQRGTP